MLYQLLGDTELQRRERYRALFSAHVDGPLLDEIRLCANRGLVLGNERFAQQIEQLTGKRVTQSIRGRPK